MADEADIAGEYADAVLAARLNARTQYAGISALFCEDCDCGIPEARRMAVPGVQLCVDCQTIRERRV